MDYSDTEFKWSTDSQLKEEEEKERQAAAAEAAALAEQKKADGAAMEARVNSGDAAGPTIEPSRTEQVAAASNTNTADVPLLGALDYLSGGNSIAGNPIQTVERGTQPGVGMMTGLMDLVSTLVPGLKPVDDKWDEVAQGVAKDDPVNKTIQDISAIVGPTALLGGGVAGTFGLGAKGKAVSYLAADIGISATSEQTSEAGNLASMFEQVLPQGYNIPWASRDSDSPDAIYAKNMFENMLLAGIPFAFDFNAAKSGNAYKPLNEKASQLIQEFDGTPTPQVKQKAQLDEGKRVLEADPNGEGGYNAFVNEPAEPVSRVTLDEKAQPMEFMADQARIQNNIGTSEGRSRPAIDNDTINVLSRADEARRASVLSKLEGDLGAQFEFSVAGKKVTKQQVEEAVNNLYDATIAADSEEAFTKVVSDLNNIETKLVSNTFKLQDKGQREIMKRAISNLVDAVSPYKQRASAVIQTQTAASVADLSRNIDMMEEMFDTSRLQELLMPRLRTLIKEVEISESIEKTSRQLRAVYAEKAGSIEGLLEIDDNYVKGLKDKLLQTARERGQKADAFVDELERMAKENPSYLRPVYNLFAKTNGDVRSQHTLFKHLDQRLGLLKKSFISDPKVPSVILSEANSARQASLINGVAPAKALVGNSWGLATHPIHTFAGSVPYALKGNLKPLQRALVGYSGIVDAFKRGRKAFRDDLRFSITNPNAARSRGRADYKFDSSTATGRTFKEDLADFEELEELSYTMSPGRQALWNMSKGIGWWNRQSMNQWGFNLMYAGDGFLKQFMATLNSRVNAYDQLAMETNGAWSKKQFRKLEKKLYKNLFDEEGTLKPGFAKFASEEIAMNAEVPAVKAMEEMFQKVPALKGIFLFPTTRANNLSRIATFDPTGAVAMWSDRSMKTIMAKTDEQIQEVLEIHGMKGASMDEFQMLKSNYIGRKIQSSGVVMSAALLATSGAITGSMSWMSKQERAERMRLGEKPEHINLSLDPEKPNYVSYEQLPTEFKLFLNLTTDVVRSTFAGGGPDDSAEWFRSIAQALAANVGNELWNSELETLHGLVDLDPKAWNRYTAGMVDSLIPGSSVRGMASSILVPQLQDTDNNWQSYLANRNRFIPPIDEALTDAIDPFDGGKVNVGSNPLEIALGKVFPFVKTKGDLSEFKSKLLATGWSGLQKPTANPINGEELSPGERNQIYANMAEQGLQRDMEKILDLDWTKEVADFNKRRGKNKEIKSKDTMLHERLDATWSKHFKQAWNRFTEDNPIALNIAQQKAVIKGATQRGDYDAADQATKYLDELRSEYSY